MAHTDGIIIGNSHVGTTRYEMESSKIPAAFDHFKIAIISDLHNAEFGAGNSRLLKLIDQIVDIAPCYYVTGNHETWIEVEYQKLEGILLDKNAAVLHDEKIRLVRDDGSIQIVGLDDPTFSG